MSNRQNEEKAPKLVDLKAAYINLKSCGVGDEVTVCLCDALAVNQCVTDIDLSGNNITDVAGDALAAMLLRNRYLKYLNLSKNHLTDLSIRSIAASLRSNAALCVLSFAGNPFGDIGVGELGRALQYNTALQELVLQDCHLTFEGAVTLSEHLRFNKSIIYLSLPFHLGYRLIAEIQKIIRRNWAREERIPSRVVEFTKARKRQIDKLELCRKAWKPTPPPEPCFRLPSSRSQWTDSVLGTTMTYLHLLDKKRKI